MTSSIVDSPAAMASLLETFPDLSTVPPSLYLDLEGTNLSRHGSVSILQLYVLPQNHVYLIDVHVLGEKAFLTASTDGRTFKNILESPGIPKAFFDVRNDSDALHGHFGIKLAGVHDIQLLENAARSFNRRCVNGLARCIEEDARMTFSEKQHWKAIKEQGRKLYDPQLGGSYEVFKRRPMTEDIKEYCVQDVHFLPGLWTAYAAKLSTAWAEEVRIQTLARVTLSQTTSFNGKGKHMALGPWPNGLPPKLTEAKKPESILRVSKAAPEAADPPSLPLISRALDEVRLGVPESSARGRKWNFGGYRDHDDDEDNVLYDLDDYHDDEPPTDFTACSSDDCGYCGHCRY